MTMTLLYQRFPEQFDEVLGVAAGAVVELVAAGEAGDGDAGIGGGADGGEELLLADGHGEVVVLLFVAEGAGHATAAGVNLFDLEAGHEA